MQHDRLCTHNLKSLPTDWRSEYVIQLKKTGKIPPLYITKNLLAVSAAFQQSEVYENILLSLFSH